MTRKRRGGAFRAVGLALAALLMVGCGGAAEQNGPQPAPEARSGDVRPFPGYHAPDFTATDVFSGEQVSLSDLRGEVVFLNFWATWCLPCKEEMPEMEAFHSEFGDRVRVLALGADSRESPEQLRKFAEAMGVTFPVIHDEGAGAFEYRVVGIPTSFFIDKNGIIQVRHMSALTLEDMKEYLAGIEKATESEVH